MSAFKDELLRRAIPPIQPTTIPVDRELWERCVGLVRRMASWPSHSTPPAAWEDEAREIAKMLPKDKLDEWDEANSIVKEMNKQGYMFANPDQAVMVALAALKRGRQLQREGGE